MSDELSYRKIAPNYSKESTWRSKQCANPAARKYTRESILRSYNPQTFSIPLTEELIPLYSVTALDPVQEPSTPFSHEILEDPNSRKPLMRERKTEQVPEWYNEDADPNSMTEELFTRFEKDREIDLEEEFSKVDTEMEKKLKNDLLEDETMPEWDDPEETPEIIQPESPKPNQAPLLICDVSTLSIHLNSGNPFAKILEENAKCADKFVYCIPLSKPFEKIWYYKDLENKTQGPFSSVEMFN